MSKTFNNPENSPRRDATFNDYASFFARRVLTSLSMPEIPDGHILERSAAVEQYEQHSDIDSITWLGHAAFLIRAGGCCILIDPYLSKTAGPGPFGPARFASPEIGLDDIGSIDAILLTHNHYDHFDIETLVKLTSHTGVHVCAPLGLAKDIRRIGFKNIAEMNWDEQFSAGPVTITSLPAIHWSKRGLWDENRTLWCGYLLEWADKRVYFSGDTGYGPVFEEMGSQWDSIDLGIVGIGAYEPASIMKPVHTTPEEAVQIGRDMNCKRILGMHWGTIVLSDEDPWEPPKRFEAAAQTADYHPDHAWLMKLGETRAMDFA